MTSVGACGASAAQMKAQAVSITLDEISLVSHGSSPPRKSTKDMDTIVDSEDHGRHPQRRHHQHRGDHPPPGHSMTHHRSSTITNGSRWWWWWWWCWPTTSRMLKMCFLLQLVLLLQPTTHSSSIAHYIHPHHHHQQQQSPQTRVHRSVRTPLMMFVLVESSEESNGGNESSIDGVTNSSTDSLMIDNYNINSNHNISDNQTEGYDNETSNNCDINPSLDFTDFDFPGRQTKVYEWEDYFKILLYVITIPAAFFGNAAVVFAVAAKRTLRVTVNLYLANLAVADVLICLFCMWVHLVNHLTSPAYVLGPLLCRFNGFAQMTCLTSSVLTLSAISCDRYMAIMYPLRSRVTKQRTGAVIATIWMFSLLIALPFMLYRRFENFQWRNYLEPNCMEEWPSTVFFDQATNQCVRRSTAKVFYYTLVTTTLFFVPVFIMLTAYSAICWKLWVNKMPGEANLANLQQQKKSTRKVVKMVVVVLLVFVICWLPLQLVVLYSSYFHTSGVLPKWFETLKYYSYFIAYSNSAFNPLIYGGFNKNFRDVLCSHWMCSVFWCDARAQARAHRDRLKRPQYSTSRTMTSVVSGGGVGTPCRYSAHWRNGEVFLQNNAMGGETNHEQQQPGHQLLVFATNEDHHQGDSMDKVELV